MHPSDFPGYWRRTRNFAVLILALVLAVAIAVNLVFPGPGDSTVMGFPLSYFLVAQGTLVAFVALGIWFALRQRHIEREFDMIHDD